MRTSPELREIRLLHGELNIQRERFGRKENSKNTRALTLIGSSTVLLGFSTSGVPGLWRLLPIGFAIAAVILGFLALRPSSGKEINLFRLDLAIRDASEYRAEQILYKNKLKAHAADCIHLESRSSLVRVGFWLVITGIAVDCVQLVIANRPH